MLENLTDKCALVTEALIFMSLCDEISTVSYMHATSHDRLTRSTLLLFEVTVSFIMKTNHV